MDSKKGNLFRDLAIVALSVIAAVVLAQTGVLESLLIKSQPSKTIGSFLAGVFFVSIFTVAPAGVVLAELARHNSIFLVSFWGGLGALTGDFLIFHFVKDRLSEDLLYLVRKNPFRKLSAVFKLKFWRWLTPIVGALIVASPLPDELGLMLMGLSKMKSTIFIPLSFGLNFLGILIVGSIIKGIM